MRLFRRYRVTIDVTNRYERFVHAVSEHDAYARVYALYKCNGPDPRAGFVHLDSFIDDDDYSVEEALP